MRFKQQSEAEAHQVMIAYNFIKERAKDVALNYCCSVLCCAICLSSGELITQRHIFLVLHNRQSASIHFGELILQTFNFSSCILSFTLKET